jgi:hypothetical protein
MHPIQICRGFTDKQWEKLRPKLTDDNEGVRQEAWECAIQVFDRRISERFLSCIRKLDEIGAAWKPVPEDAPPDCSALPAEEAVVAGFVIVGLCCLLIETLQFFRSGDQTLPEPPGPCPYPKECIKPAGTSRAFKKFLKRDSFGKAFEGKGLAGESLAYDFIEGVRHGILHRAETRRWIIRKATEANQLVETEGDTYVLNRTLFYAALDREFGSYKDELRSGQDIPLRENFIRAIEHIVNECRADL